MKASNLILKLIYSLLGLAILGVILWSGYWFYSTNLLKRHMNTYLTQQKDISASAIKLGGLTGYPFNIEVNFENLTFTSPPVGGEVRHSIRFPKVEIAASIWQPENLLLNFGDNVLYRASDGEQIIATFSNMSGTFKLADWKQKYWEKIELDIANLNVTHISTLGVSSTLKAGSLQIVMAGDERRPEDNLRRSIKVSNFSYEDAQSTNTISKLSMNLNTRQKQGDFEWVFRNIRPKLNDRALSTFSSEFEFFGGKASYKLNKSVSMFDLSSLATDTIASNDLLEELNLHKLKIKFGDAEFDAEGIYQSNGGQFSDAYASLSLKLKNTWQQQAEKLHGTGVLSSAQYISLESFLKTLQGFSSSDEHLNLVFILEDGVVLLDDKPLSEAFM